LVPHTPHPTSPIPPATCHQAVECLSFVAVEGAVLAFLIAQGLGRQLVHFILLPRLVTDTFLAYSFDYAPHHPHDTRRADDIYACTSMIGGLLHPQDGIDLTFPLIYQNYHNIHHLYPTVPFYKYPALWLNHRKELLALGTPIGSWFGCWRVDRPAEETAEEAVAVAGGGKRE
jgi:beta-carotene hydroxylase